MADTQMILSALQATPTRAVQSASSSSSLMAPMEQGITDLTQATPLSPVQPISPYPQPSTPSRAIATSATAAAQRLQQQQQQQLVVPFAGFEKMGDEPSASAAAARPRGQSGILTAQKRLASQQQQQTINAARLADVSGRITQANLLLQQNKEQNDRKTRSLSSLTSTLYKLTEPFLFAPEPSFRTYLDYQASRVIEYLNTECANKATCSMSVDDLSRKIQEVMGNDFSAPNQRDFRNGMITLIGITIAANVGSNYQILDQSGRAWNPPAFPPATIAQLSQTYLNALNG